MLHFQIFNEIFNSIERSIPEETVETFHNGTGYFDNICRFKEDGWFKFVDTKYNRRGIYFRNGREYLCIHERYSNGVYGVIVSTGKYFHSALKLDEMKIVEAIFIGMDEINFEEILGQYLNGKYLSSKYSSVSFFNIKIAFEEGESIIELAGDRITKTS